MSPRARRSPAWSAIGAALFALAMFAVQFGPGLRSEPRCWSAEAPRRTERDAASSTVIEQVQRRLAQRDAFAADDRQRLAERLNSARDSLAAAAAVTAALAASSDEYRAALSALDAPQPPAVSLEPLEQLASSSDSLLAADAAFHLAAKRRELGDAAGAAPLLESLARGALAAHTLRGPEAMLLLALAQAEELDRAAAQQTLAALPERFPQAAPAILESAQVQTAALQAVTPESLADIGERMAFSGRRLQWDRVDEPTSGQQQSIVAALDRLIDDAERQQRSAGQSGQSKRPNQAQQRQAGKGKSGQRGGRQPAAGAEQSNVSAGNAENGELVGAPRSARLESWDALKQREREQVLTTLKGRFPDRYQRLIEQYYRSLQDER